MILEQLPTLLPHIYSNSAPWSISLQELFGILLLDSIFKNLLTDFQPRVMLGGILKEEVYYSWEMARPDSLYNFDLLAICVLNIAADQCCVSMANCLHILTSNLTFNISPTQLTSNENLNNLNSADSNLNCT